MDGIVNVGHGCIGAVIAVVAAALAADGSGDEDGEDVCIGDVVSMEMRT